MNAEFFAEWFRRQGRNVIRTQSCFWVNNGLNAYQAFPYHWQISPSEAELQQVFQEEKAICLRYSAPLNSPIGHASYHVIYDNQKYDIKLLIKKARSDIRRGLKRCNISPLSFCYLSDAGWILQSDTQDRQGRNGAVSEFSWKKLCQAASKLPGFEAWGAIVNNNLAASLITCRVDNYSYFLWQQSRRSYLSVCVNNVICYHVSNLMLQHPEIDTIFYGIRSLDAPASVDEFKFRMGYRPKVIRQRVVFHPCLAPLINNVSHRLVKLLLQKNPSNVYLAKAEGLIRFYLEGLKPLEEQTWPEVINPQKEKILKNL